MTTERYKEDISFILKELQNIHYPAGPLFQRNQRCKALNCLNSSEVKAIYNLVESHSPGLRNKAVLRYEKLLSNDVEPINNNIPLLSTKDDIALKCPTDQIEENIKSMLKQVEEMPQEWTLIQLTPQYNPLDNINEDNKLYYTNPIHITVFNCGQRREEPFMVTVDAPRDLINGNKMELAQEMMSIIIGNKEALTSNKQKTFKSHKEKLSYFSRRQVIEDRLKAIIKDMQDMWLKEWRCLLSGKYHDTNLEDQIKCEITNFLKSIATEEVSEKSKTILGYAIKGARHLKLMEIKRIVQFCFPQTKDKVFLKNVVQFINSVGDKLIMKGTNIKKYPLILIVDDSLDCFPWEMIDILQDEPVSRVPSLHFIYSLFKEHKKDIVNGHKIVTDFDKGAYIVNPDMDLKNMEIRMMNFFNYWTPNWIGTSGCQPGSDEFFELLTSCDIFSYNGHGSGSHLFSVDKIQRTHVKAVVLLFGCGSTKVNRMDPQAEMYGPYHMYLIARCPCVVGMLWEVTDLDTDILTTEFMSQWIPSEVPLHWKYVDKSKWNKAEEKIKFVRNKMPIEIGNNCEPELLRALNLSKKTVSFYGTKSACVVRGLPVKIQLVKNK